MSNFRSAVQAGPPFCENAGNMPRYLRPRASPSLVSRAARVFALTSSTDTPGASSISFSPLGPDFHHAQVGDDQVHDAHARQGQRAFGQQLDVFRPIFLRAT